MGEGLLCSERLRLAPGREGREEGARPAKPRKAKRLARRDSPGQRWLNYKGRPRGGRVPRARCAWMVKKCLAEAQLGVPVHNWGSLE